MLLGDELVRCLAVPPALTLPQPSAPFEAADVCIESSHVQIDHSCAGLVRCAQHAAGRRGVRMHRQHTRHMLQAEGIDDERSATARCTRHHHISHCCRRWRGATPRRQTSEIRLLFGQNQGNSNHAVVGGRGGRAARRGAGAVAGGAAGGQCANAVHGELHCGATWQKLSESHAGQIQDVAH